MHYVSDFVLVYEDDMETIELKNEGKIGKKDKDKMTIKDKHEIWRQKFLANLKKAGLEMEEVKKKLLLGPEILCIPFSLSLSLFLSLSHSISLFILHISSIYFASMIPIL